MTIIFNGREFAKKKEEELKLKVAKLKEKKVTPKLVSVLVGDDPASALYTSLKKKAAERVGAEMDVRHFSEDISIEELANLISNLNKDASVHGIMIQLPLPEKLKSETNKITSKIDPLKDVDGLNEKSDFIPATVKAIVLIMKEASSYLFDNVVVVGSTGMVGKPLIKLLKELEYKVSGVDVTTKNIEQRLRKADLIISATGHPDLIKEDMVSDGVVIIDVGSPKGDVDESVYKRASFYTPVPGGVGPVTIISLLDNLVIATR